MSELKITGVSGFVGRHLVKKLCRDGISHTALDLRINSGVKKHNPSRSEALVVHLAADTEALSSWQRPGQILGNNLLSTIQVLEFCRESSSKLIFASTSLAGLTSTEEEHNDIVGLSSLSPYHASKNIGENLCHYYHATYGLDIAILRIFSVYGLGQRESSLIPTVVRQTFSDCPEIVVRSTRPRRDFIHVEDVVDAIVTLSEGIKGYEELEIGTGIATSVREVIDIVQRHAATNKPVIETETNYSGDEQIVVSRRSNVHSSQWNPKIGLYEGIRSLVSSEFGEVSEV